MRGTGNFPARACRSRAWRASIRQRAAGGRTSRRAGRDERRRGRGPAASGSCRAGTGRREAVNTNPLGGLASARQIGFPPLCRASLQTALASISTVPEVLTLRKEDRTATLRIPQSALEIASTEFRNPVTLYRIHHF